MKSFLLVAAILGLLQSGVSDATMVCSNVTRTVASSADYLFVIDGSGSMCDKVDAVASGLSAFAGKVQSSMIQARYAVVQYGGVPKIMLPFSSNVTVLQQVFYALGCSSGGQEAAFEALRGSLPPLSGAGFLRRCGQFTSDPCGLTWNVNATKVIILLTDEDSDLPTMASYRMSGQSSATSYCVGSNYFLNGTCTTDQFEPAFLPTSIVKYKTAYNIMRSGTGMRLGAEYEEELATTADLLIRNGIFLNMVVSTSVGTMRGLTGQPVSAFNANDSPFFKANITDPSLADNVTTATYQFGHPGFQVQAANFSSFNSASTLSLLSANGFNNSMQARILRAGLFARVYDIVNFNGTSQPAIISAFYNSIVETTSYLEQFCQIIVDASSSSSSTDAAVTTSADVSTSIIDTVTMTSGATSTDVIVSSLSASSVTAFTSSALVETTATFSTPVVVASSPIASSLDTSVATSATPVLAASTPIVVASSSLVGGPSSTPVVLPTVIKSSSIVVAVTASASRSAAVSSVAPSVSETDSATPEVTQQSITTDGGKESSNGLIIALVVGLGLLIFFIAALYALYRSRYGARFLKNHQALATVFGLSKQNPLYKDQFGFHDNPMYARNSEDGLAAGAITPDAVASPTGNGSQGNLI